MPVELTRVPAGSVMPALAAMATPPVRGARNLSVGDSIFHCHMYPHFAQGMWGLWRNHDVFEDGTRALPDGELGKGTEATVIFR